MEERYKDGSKVKCSSTRKLEKRRQRGREGIKYRYKRERGSGWGKSHINIYDLRTRHSDMVRDPDGPCPARLFAVS